MNIKSCKIASRLISDSFERKLSFKEKLSLNVHLVMCKGCTLAYKQLKGLNDLFSHYAAGISAADTPANKSLSEDAKSRIKIRIAQEN